MVTDIVLCYFCLKNDILAEVIMVLNDYWNGYLVKVWFDFFFFVEQFDGWFLWFMVGSTQYN